MLDVLLIHPSPFAVNDICDRLQLNTLQYRFHHLQMLTNSVQGSKYGLCLVDQSCLPPDQYHSSLSLFDDVPTLCLSNGKEVPISYQYDTLPPHFGMLYYHDLSYQCIQKAIKAVSRIFKLSQEAKRYHQQTQYLSKELSQLNRKLEHFTNFVSHDIRPHVCRILGLSELTHLSDDRDESSKFQRLTQVSAQALDDMIMSVHEYFSIQPMILSGKREPTILSELVNEVLHDFQIKHGAFDARVEVHLDDDIALNLLSKALKLCLENIFHAIQVFTHSGSRVVVSYRWTGEQFCLIVNDDGSGYASNRKRKLPESNLEVSTYMAYILMEDLGVEMGVNSTSGQSTTYNFKFSKTHLLSEPFVEKGICISQYERKIAG